MSNQRPPLLQQMLDDLSEYITGHPVSPTTCTTCGQSVEGMRFKDGLSQREFEISGMCQSCQDEFFEEDGDDWPDSTIRYLEEHTSDGGD